MCLFSGVQFKCPMGVVLNISGEGVIIWWAFSEVESGLSKLPGEGAWDETYTQTSQTLFVYGCQVLGMEFPSNIPGSLGIWMPGTEVKLSPKHPRLLPVHIWLLPGSMGNVLEASWELVGLPSMGGVAGEVCS